VGNQTLVFQIKFCGKSPALRVAAKRYLQFVQTSMRQAFYIIIFFSFLISAHGQTSQTDSILVDEGQKLYSEGKYKAALNSFELAIKTNPNNVKAHRLKGETHYRLKNHKDAIIEFNRALALDSSDNKSLLDLGVSQSLAYFKTHKIDFLTQSEQTLRKCIDKNYEVAFANMQLSYCEFYKKDYSKSWEYIHKVREIDEGQVNRKFVLELLIVSPDPKGVYKLD